MVKKEEKKEKEEEEKKEKEEEEEKKLAHTGWDGTGPTESSTRGPSWPKKNYDEEKNSIWNGLKWRENPLDYGDDVYFSKACSAGIKHKRHKTFHTGNPIVQGIRCAG